ncbi:hypothetical protein [Sphingobacterium daejeonense]|nr:hypothetical protein [Sphingobacterium daejeonense]
MDLGRILMSKEMLEQEELLQKWLMVVKVERNFKTFNQHLMLN